MPRYYFHLLNDIDAPDEDGVELPDLDAALRYARRNALFTAAETIKEHGHLVEATGSTSRMPRARCLGPSDSKMS